MPAASNTKKLKSFPSSEDSEDWWSVQEMLSCVGVVRWLVRVKVFDNRGLGLYNCDRKFHRESWDSYHVDCYGL